MIATLEGDVWEDMLVYLQDKLLKTFRADYQIYTYNPASRTGTGCQSSGTFSSFHDREGFKYSLTSTLPSY